MHQLLTTLNSAIQLANGKHITFRLSGDNIQRLRQQPDFTPCTNPSSPRVGYFKGVEVYYEN